MKQAVISRSLGSATDLTLMAPIRPGVTQSYEMVTYRTRLALVLRTLHFLRASAREEVAYSVFSDPVERIEAIHSFRLAITPGDRPSALLSVTFDHSWEPYIRLIWRDLGRIIDLMFCNTLTNDQPPKPYPLSSVGFEAWARWVRDHQVQTDYFYNATAITVGDLSYLTGQERLLRECGHQPNLDLDACRKAIESAADRARRVRDRCTADETLEQGLRGLAALHRLVRYHGGDATCDENELLRAAARDLLHEWEPANLSDRRRQAYAAQLAWYGDPPSPAASNEVVATPPLDQVQAGILAHRAHSHGALILVQFPPDTAKARAWLGAVRSRITSEEAAGNASVQQTIAVTAGGLSRLIGGEAMRGWPEEFRQGAEQRAPSLGDLRSFHPRSWTPPRRNWPEDSDVEIDLRAVDAVIQLRCRSNSEDHEIVGNAQHPLHPEVADLAAQAQAHLVTVVSVQAMRCADLAKSDCDHFGFRDGISQPRPGEAQAAGRTWQDRVNLGEVLLGHANDSGEVQSDELRRNGTFLVVRRMRQHRDHLDELIASRPEKMDVEEFERKLMGRDRAGIPATTDDAGPDDNDFTFAGDKEGRVCPFQAHIRRANPRGSRDEPDTKPRPPRIVRRGMSFGPTWTGPDDKRERGVMFMAYCASIAEQYEVIQRWINGGNSSGVGSMQADPLMGVPQSGEDRVFAFEREVGGRCQVERVKLPAKRPPVELHWTAYFFVPSLDALAMLASGETPAAASRQAPSPLAQAGEALIRRLSAAPPDHAYAAWQSVLDDPGARDAGLCAQLWAAVREIHGGALRTPYGVLVGSRALCDEVLRSPGYSVAGYLDRARRSIGAIYLGLDDGEAYRSQSGAANAAIRHASLDEGGKASPAPAFERAQTAAANVLGEMAGSERFGLLDLTTMIDRTLGELCRVYFGVPDGKDIVIGGLDLGDADGTPRCPGHFYSPSRYMFDPTPSKMGEEFGQRHGRALYRTVLRLAQRREAFAGTLIAERLCDDPAYDDDDLFARTLVGVMMGFLPTTFGSLAGVFLEWIGDRSLWRLQSVLPRRPSCAQAQQALGEALFQAMQKRPAPDMIWRLARDRRMLGDVTVENGDLIVIGIYAQTEEARLLGKPDVIPIFGGDRDGSAPPLHACPGYAMAIGTMLGVLAALLDHAVIRDTGIPLTLEVKLRQ